MADYVLDYPGLSIDSFLDTVNELQSNGYIFRGVATPSTNPGTTTEKIAYIASEAGTYTNFGGIIIGPGLYVLTFDGSAWSKSEILQNIPSISLDDVNCDLDITDQNGYVLVRFYDGQIKTKKFDSKKTPQIVDNDNDLLIADNNGNVLFKINNGNITVKNFNSAPLYGKRVSFMGDSITTFMDFPTSSNPFYTGTNAGITNLYMTWWGNLCKLQGATINHIYAHGGGNVINDICLHYNSLYSGGTSGVAPDYIFILAGINDFGHDKTLGTINDAENSNTTFYGAYKYLLKNLKNEYPYAKIIGLTLLNSMYNGTVVPYINNNNDSIRDFCDAIIKCCDYYSVPCIDINKIVNINGGNYTTYLADLTHPNSVGAALITKAIINNLISI